MSPTLSQKFKLPYAFYVKLQKISNEEYLFSIYTKAVNSVFPSSDRLLNLGQYVPFSSQHFFWILCSSFAPFLRKKGTIWCWLFTEFTWYKLKQLFTSVSEKSGGYLTRGFAARQMSSNHFIHVHFDE